MKISIIMGRGIEGCGVTKFTLEQTKWLKKNGYDFVVYSSSDKKWSRKKSHDVSNVIQLKFAKSNETQTMIDGCNNSDVVIINSLPSINHGDKCISEFKRALNEIKKPIVLIQHDHSALSIKRNAALDDVIKRANIIFAHSSNNDFSKYVKQIAGGAGLDQFMGYESTEILNFQPGIDFDDIRAKYWKDINDQDNRHNKWIGRTTSWKGYKEMFKFHNEYLRPNNYITTFEGIEKSPAYLDFKKLSDFNAHIDDDINTISLLNDQPAYVFGPYINDQMLERMSKVAFGYQLSTLNANFIERSIEYTHCELACVGVIPVFRKTYGERCTHRVHGTRLIDCKDSGTIWLDDNDMAPALNMINQLSKDNVMRNEWREKAFEFYKSHQDAQPVFEEMMIKIKDRL